MDEDSKRRTRERAMRHFSRELGYEEKKERRANGRRGKGKKGPRPRMDERAADELEPVDGLEAMGRKPAAPPQKRDVTDLPLARVVAVDRGQVVLEGDRTARLGVHLAVDLDQRVVVGDWVRVSETSGQLRAEALEPRQSVLARFDGSQPGGSGLGRSIPMAANIDLGVIAVAAADPPLRPGLIDRMLIALELGLVAPLVCVNKVDLLDGAQRDDVERLVAPYRDLGIGVVLCSTHTGEGIAALRRHVAGQVVVFSGHSGVGKSSLLNALDGGDGALRRTGDVREFDGKGRHTTTRSEMRPLGDDGTWLIDTPGVRAFGLAALPPNVLAEAFPEFAAAPACRFANCSHRHEPECGVREAVAEGRIPAARMASYLRLLAEE